MYKVANDKSQDAARRLTLAELQRGGIEVTPAIELESLRAALAPIVQRLSQDIPKAERKLLGHDARWMEDRIAELKKIVEPRRIREDLSHFIIEVARESVHKLEWQRWVAEARKRFEAQEETEPPR